MDIIVCFINDSNLFPGLILAVIWFYQICQKYLFLPIFGEKYLISSPKKNEEKSSFFSSKSWLKLFVHQFPFTKFASLQFLPTYGISFV